MSYDLSPLQEQVAELQIAVRHALHVQIAEAHRHLP